MENVRIMKRREFMIKTAIAGMMAPLTVRGMTNTPAASLSSTVSIVENIICAFSKTFQWLGYDDLAVFLAEAGFEGIDLTVRPDGHVLPENVERDLPAAVKAAQKQKLSIPMIVTAITDATDPFTERILKTAADQGVKYYRLGYYQYDSKLSIPKNLENVRKQMEALAKLNERYGLQGGYQNHAGSNVGSPVWDLYLLLKDLNPQYIGCQYDVRHASVEGFNSWTLGFKAIAQYVKHECIKDYIYINNNGKWGIKSVPLGTGAIDFKKYFALRKEYGINGPLTYHFEFDLGEDSSLPVKERMKQVMPVVCKEAETLRTLLKKSL